MNLVPFQTKLAIDTNLVVADTHMVVADTRTVVPDIRGVVVGTHAMIADIHRGMLTGLEGASGQNHSVFAIPYVS